MLGHRPSHGLTAYYGGYSASNESARTFGKKRSLRRLHQAIATLHGEETIMIEGFMIGLGVGFLLGFKIAARMGDRHLARMKHLWRH